MSLLTELKRRNVIRVAIAYIAGAWLLTEVSGTLFPAFGIPDWGVRFVVIVLALGFLPTLIISWAYELTPEGLKREKDVVRDASITHFTAKRLDGITIGLIVFAVAFVLVDRLWLATTATTAAATEAVEKTAQSGINPPEATAPENSIAVLPFQNLSGIEEDAFFTDGMHDEILTRLSKIGGLSMRGRTSVMAYRDSPKNLREIGEELNARYIIEGGVQRGGGTVRINIQLIEASTDQHLWADTYDRAMSVDNVFSIQTEIVGTVTDSVRALVSPGELVQIESQPTDNLEAYDLYLLGRHYLARWSPDAIDQAIEYFQRAVRVDPGYAQGFAGLAYGYAALGAFGGMHPRESWPRARKAAEAALEIDNGLAEAHTALAMEAMSYRYDWEVAEAGFERALEVNPNSVDALVWYGLFLGGIRARLDDAGALLARAQELDPLSRDVRYNLGVWHIWSKRHEEAARVFQGLTKSDPDFILGWEGLAEALAAQGNYEEAVRLLRPDMVFANLDYLRAFGQLGFLYGRMGRRADALAVLERLDQLEADGRYVPPWFRAMVYAGLDEKDEALAWLERGYDNRDHWLIWLGTDRHLWGNLLSTPQFNDLLRRMDLGRQ
jgi:TolB-like protein/tetratricopeptide (TPR) repeat protein